MVGDMFNYGLKATVDNLCSELSTILANNQLFPVIPAGTPGSNQWWPVELGTPFSSGAQNSTRYAVFPNRLAVELNGNVSIYDTLNHNIGGVSQQQGGDTSLTFSSQFGTVSVNALPLISGQGVTPAPQTNFANPINQDPNPHYAAPLSSAQEPNALVASHPDSLDVGGSLDLLGKLAQLRDAGALTEDEFNNKKIQILNRI